MIPIPGILIAVLTFPGVIVHEAAHLLFCKWRRVPVFAVCFFQFGNPAGYVIHGPVNSFLSSFLIAVGPLLINSLLCVFFCFPAFFPVHVYDTSDPIAYFFTWLGVSIGMHAFPSIQDGTNLWHEAKIAAKQWNPLAILSMPLVGLIILANVGSMIWLDLIYGIALGIWLPEMLLKQLS